MKGTVLLYNIRDIGRKSLIQNALTSLGHRIVYVEKKDYLKPIGVLAGEKLFLTVDKVYDGPQMEDMMLVMAGMDSRQVDKVLKALRESGAGSIPCKAVLTETNKFWTSMMLYEELKKEHEEFMKRNR